MSKYTAEQVESAAEILEQDQNTPSWKRLSAMLRDYAALLRERESAKAGVTDERLHELVHGVIAPNHSELTEDGDGYYLSCDALEAFTRDVIKVVAPHLASARVPAKRDLSLCVTEYQLALDAGFNQCVDAMLAAAPKRGEG